MTSRQEQQAQDDYLDHWAGDALLRRMEEYQRDPILWETLALWYISDARYTPYDHTQFDLSAYHRPDDGSDWDSLDELRRHARNIRDGMIEALSAQSPPQAHSIQHALPPEQMARLLSSESKRVREVAQRAAGKPPRPSDPAPDVKPMPPREGSLADTPVVLPESVRERLGTQEDREEQAS